MTLRRPLRCLTILLLLTTVFVTPVAAQQPETGQSAAVETAAAILISLVVGGGLILFAPEYTKRTTDRIHDRPGETLVYGIGIGIVLAIVLVILILSVIGLLIAIPLAFVIIVLGELGYLAIGRLVSDNWGIVLVIAIAASALVGGVPILGALLGFVLSSLGIGTAFLDYRTDG